MGKPAARKTDTANHDPVDGWSSHQIDEGSNDVNINGKPAARKGDKLTDHFKGQTVHFPSTPTPKISGGSSTVFINGKAAARKEDDIDCSSKINAGSGDVSIG